MARSIRTNLSVGQSYDYVKNRESAGLRARRTRKRRQAGYRPTSASLAQLPHHFETPGARLVCTTYESSAETGRAARLRRRGTPFGRRTPRTNEPAWDRRRDGSPQALSDDCRTRPGPLANSLSRSASDGAMIAPQRSTIRTPRRRSSSSTASRAFPRHATRTGSLVRVCSLRPKPEASRSAVRISP